MQTDKSSLAYRSIPHWQYLSDLLAPIVEESWISCREQQRRRYDKALVLPDDPHAGIEGPAAGILAAHRRFPKAAWIIIACDLPLITAAGLHALLAARNPERRATAVWNPEKKWPEPLFAIWEPSGLEFFTWQVNEGNNSPRSILEQCRPALLSLPNPEEFFNANTPAERANAEKLIAKRADKS